MHCYAFNYSRARASRVTEVSREGRTYKEKGEPIGTMPDRLAGTAVNSVISWKTLSLTILDPCLMLPLSLAPVYACHLWIWPLSCWQLWSPSPHFSFLFTSTFFSLHFPISSLPFLVTSLFFRVPTDFTSLFSSLPYSLHFSTLFPFSTFFTSNSLHFVFSSNPKWYW